jgi:hypothetical protein
MTPARARRAVFLQSQVRELKMRREFGQKNLDRIIAATETLLFVEEASLAADGLFITPDGVLVEIPEETYA